MRIMDKKYTLRFIKTFVNTVKRLRLTALRSPFHNPPFWDWGPSYKDLIQSSWLPLLLKK